MKIYYSIRCWLDINPCEDMCRLTFEDVVNAKKVYEAVCDTMEYDKVQLVKKEGRKEILISATTKEEVMYNLPVN